MRNYENGKARKRSYVLVFWLLYGMALAYLLFICRFGATYDITYGEWLAQSYNLVPGRAFYDYLTAPYQAPVVLHRLVFNYIGNLLLFIPWGILFALGKTKTKRFIIHTVIVVISVELFQYLTMLGSFDIEDVILNVIGAIIGFLIVRQVKNKKVS